jgi:hypothetical protein
MFKKGIMVSLWGTGIEAVGIFLDIMHHLNIGMKTPEGLITPNHLIIFAGFLINFIGVIITMISRKNGAH